MTAVPGLLLESPSEGQVKCELLTTRIAPPVVCRAVVSSSERSKMISDTRHPLHDNFLVPQRLESRKSFLKCVVPLTGERSQERLKLWRDCASSPKPFVPPADNLPPGHELPWVTWKFLNKVRTQVGRSKENQFKWRFIDDSALECKCGAVPQTIGHLISCLACPVSCTLQEQMDAGDGAKQVAEFLAESI